MTIHNTDGRDPDDGLAHSGGSHDAHATETANASEGKPLNDLQIALKEKFEAERTFVGGSQTKKAEAEAIKAKADTKKADAETLVLQVKKLEAEAEVKRLDAEVDRLKTENLRLQAEVNRTVAERAEREANARFISGPSSYKTRQEGHKAKFEMIMGVVIFSVILFFLFAISK